MPLPLAVNVVFGTMQLNARPLSVVIVAPGTALFNVVVALAVLVHPLVPVTVTLNVPAVLTVIAAVVAPVDHK